MALVLVAACFLPLFPLSIIMNGVLLRLRNPAARFVFLLLWPQSGVVALQFFNGVIPGSMVTWALISSGLYALRLLTVNDLGLWAGFLASSSLALAWGMAGQHAGIEMHLFVFWFSLPAALLALLAGPLVKRFGAAYAGLYGGLANTMPRWSGLLAITMFAAIATPPSPGFFAMLNLLKQLDGFAAFGILVIWLLWGWAAIKLLQGFLLGSDCKGGLPDLGRISTLLFTGVLGAFIITGLYATGVAL